MNTTKIQDKSTMLRIMGVFVVVGACLVMGFSFLTGCAAEKSATSQMVDYYSINEVKAYHGELQSVLTETSDALNAGDSAKLTKALDELDVLCDGLIAVSDVPEALQPYHEKMMEAAECIKSYGKAVRDEKIEEAAEEISVVKTKLEQAMELLPATESNS